MSDANVNTVPPQPKVEEEEVHSEEEPTLDAETLKALKNCSIDDEIAKADFSLKDKKAKNSKKNKKTNAKKGQDFLDFAQEKGIELKIQYEDKEENKKPYFQRENNMQFKGGKFQHKNNEFYNNNKDGNSNNNFNNNSNYKNNYNNNNNRNFNKYPNKNFHFQNKYKNNKFDQANNMMYNPMMYGQMRPNMMNPYAMNANMQNPNYATQQQQQEMDPFFIGERSVEEIIAYVFSPEFLNKEVYIRKRIQADGLIDLNHVLNYNKIKVRNIDAEQVKLALSNMQPSVVEFYESEGKNLLKINDWENIQSQLMTVEQIQLQKRAMKTQRYQANMNYIALQNNYFFQPNHYGQMPGMMPGMMEQMQPNPYMTQPMGQMNLPPFQQNFMPGMNPQFQAPKEEANQQA